jgi:aldehyde dehydrogenase (NAD+)
MTKTSGVRGRLWIGGEARDAKAGGRFEVFAPADGKVIGTAARAEASDVDDAVRAARAGFEAWERLPVGQREEVLLRAADLVERRAEALTELLIDESGSAFLKAKYEVLKGAELLRTAAGEARRLYGDTFPNDRPHRLSMVFREPMGIVASISPFNAPLALFAKMTVFPLAAGNAVVAKPSEETPLIALAYAELIMEAGLPKGALNVVTGFGADCGDPLVRHRDIQAIAFTGSTHVGRAIGMVAADHMKRVQLELGGKNALLVLRDFDVEKAAHLACVGAFSHAGQICMSGSRILVERPIAAAFCAALKRRCEGLFLGDLRDPKTAYGPVIHARALEKVQRHVKDALDHGATLLTGGEVHRGLVYKPTVLIDPPRACAVHDEETFGPLASVYVVDDVEQAVALANETEFGLSAGVLTNDLRLGLSLSRRIRAGAVHLGTHSFWSDALSPIGGFGYSGIGRSGGKYSIEHFTELKWVSAELGDTPLPF